MAHYMIPIVVLVLGILLWALPESPKGRPHPKINEAGRILFAIGAAILTWMLRARGL